MIDIFNRTVQDGDVVSFPFVKQGPYYNSRKEVHLSYGVVKGSRIYLLDNDGKLIYKGNNRPESMILRLSPDELPQEAIEKIRKIRYLMDAKIKK